MPDYFDAAPAKHHQKLLVQFSVVWRQTAHLFLHQKSMTPYQKFFDLHAQDKPLLLGNVWDVSSAKIFEKLEFQALGTSSAAMAKTLGYSDGEQMPFSDLLFMVEKIAKSTPLPLSVDLEAGYGNNAEQIVENVAKLHQLGVAGINIEDSKVIRGSRKLVEAEAFANTLSDIADRLKAMKMEIFLNVRIDTFLLDIPNKLEETKRRIRLYERANAQGIFIPCITEPSDIAEINAFTALPINVMCMPALPDFKTLAQLGVKRISMGNFLHEYSYSALETAGKNIIENDSFHAIFAK